MLGTEFHVNQPVFALVTGYYLLQEMRGDHSCRLETRLPGRGRVQPQCMVPRAPPPASPPPPPTLPRLPPAAPPAPGGASRPLPHREASRGGISSGRQPLSAMATARLGIVAQALSHPEPAVCSCAPRCTRSILQGPSQVPNPHEVLPLLPTCGGLSPSSWFTLNLCPGYDLACPD